MTRKILLAIPLAVAACSLGTDPTVLPPVPVVAIRPAALDLAPGGTDSLFAFVSGVASSANRTMDWTVGDTTVVRLTVLSPPDHALVTGLRSGTTAVTAAWHSDPTVRASSAVMVR